MRIVVLASLHYHGVGVVYGKRNLQAPASAGLYLPFRFFRREHLSELGEHFREEILPFLAARGSLLLYMLNVISL